jgi:Cu(I)/Ag(I) efflux system membrane fusion protein
MKPIIALSLTAVFLACAPHVQASESTKAIITSYLGIQSALAADKMDGVKPAADAIGKEAARMGAAGDAVQKAAKALQSAPDLKAARTAFGPLSDAVIAAAEADGWKDLPPLKIGFCPMVNQSWIQREGKVSNPYYGSEMLTCGTLTDPKDAKK